MYWGTQRSIPSVVALVVGLVALMGGSGSATDEPDEMMRGKSFVLKRGYHDRLKFTCLAPLDSTLAMPSATNDPTVVGATLRIRDTGGSQGNDRLYSFPVRPRPLGWRGLGNPPGSKGFRYRGTGRFPAHPDCRVVAITPKRFRARCHDPVLFPPFKGDMTVTLTVGQGSKRYCARFSNFESRLKGRKVVTRAEASPAPTSCSPSGAFLDVSSSLLD